MCAADAMSGGCLCAYQANRMEIESTVHVALLLCDLVRWLIWVYETSSCERSLR